MTKWAHGALCAVVLAFLCGCQSEPESQPAPDESAVQDESLSPVTSAWTEQKLIRTAEMTVEVESVEQALSDVQEIAASRDGLLAGAESEMDDAGNRRATIQVRVPSASFEAALRELRELGTVERERLATEDVTKAYADLETRLSAKRQTEARLRELLASRTGDVAEVLQVEREIGRLIGEIEQLEGERRYYDRRIAISTIEMELYEKGAAIRPSIFAPVADALSDSMSVLALSAGAVIYVVVFLAPWLVVGLPIWWLVRRRWRDSGKQ